MRLGEGKIKIPQSEILKIKEKRSDLGYLADLPKKVRLERKKRFEEVVEKAKQKNQPGLPALFKTPAPRPGKSLEELSGEPIAYTLNRWLKKKVGLPKLFDWFIGTSSIVLGLSMFLYTRQLEVFDIGGFTNWLVPLKFSFILLGLGIIVMDMVQQEFPQHKQLPGYIKFCLAIAYSILAGILLLGNDIDGFVIYGLFAITILVETFFSVRSSTTYMVYTTSLLTAIGLVILYFPADPALASISAALINILDGFNWVWLVLMGSLVLVMVYGFFWDKRVLKIHSAYVGMLLGFLALYFMSMNYWDKGFFVLIASMIGMILPYWETFKLKFRTDRLMVFRMFGIIIFSFSMMIVLIAFVQSVLFESFDDSLADKSDHGREIVQTVINNSFATLKTASEYPQFQKSFIEKNKQDIDDFSEALFKENKDLGVILYVDSFGKIITTYPYNIYPYASPESGQSVATEHYFSDIKDNGKYISKSTETLLKISDDSIIVGVSIISEDNVFLGELISTINLHQLGDRLYSLIKSNKQQTIALIDSDGKWLFAPQGFAVGDKVGDANTASQMLQNDSDQLVGYDSSGSHSLFRSSKLEDTGWAVVISEPIFSIYYISRPGLMIVLFLLAISILTVTFSFIFSKPVEKVLD